MTDDNQTRLSQPRPSAPAADATRMAQPRPSFQQPKKKGFNKLLLLIPVVFILFIILGVVGYFAVTKFLDFDGIVTETETVEQRDYSPAEALDELSGLNLSLARIQEIEKNVVHTGTTADEEQLNRRLIALKHLYTNEFMRDNHTVQNLRNVYMLYSTDFSQSQQNLLKWFLALPNNKQLQWEYVQGGVQDFNDFKLKVESEMNRTSD
ncbi:MAG: hypothetical protein IJ588_12740 [Prevotella sp.]|nr:hypothetical protein [Prevotella sp.]